MQPLFLKTGDSVFLLNISRKGTLDISVIVQTIKSWGLNPIVGNTLAASGFCQFAADKQTRLMDLQKAIDNPDIKALFFCRGGYGAVQLIDEVDFIPLKSNPKWIIGYSDITYLHSHLHQHFSMQTIHGPMLFSFDKVSTEKLIDLKNCLFGQREEIVFLGCSNYKINTVVGRLVGGNLSILHTCIGTPSDIDTENKILIIEDVNENLMSIERMLYALKRAGKLSKLKALLLGDFIIPLKDNETSNNIVEGLEHPTKENVQVALQKMVLNLLSEYSYPICFGLPVGHVLERNAPLVLGATIQLQTSSNQVRLNYVY